MAVDPYNIIPFGDKKIYLGGIAMGDEEVNRQSLKKLIDKIKEDNGEEITHVVSCVSPVHVDATRLGGVKVKQHMIGVNDGENHIKSFLDDAVKFVDDAMTNNGNVLIHCTLGKSRSVSVLMAYFLKQNMYNEVESHPCRCNEVLKHIQKHRLIANPSFQFMYQVMTYAQ